MDTEPRKAAANGARKSVGYFSDRPVDQIVPYEDKTLRSVCTRSLSRNGFRIKLWLIGEPMLADAISSL